MYLLIIKPQLRDPFLEWHSRSLTVVVQPPSLFLLLFPAQQSNVILMVVILMFQHSCNDTFSSRSLKVECWCDRLKSKSTRSIHLRYLVISLLQLRRIGFLCFFESLHKLFSKATYSRLQRLNINSLFWDLQLRRSDHSFVFRSFREPNDILLFSLARRVNITLPFEGHPFPFAN